MKRISFALCSCLFLMGLFVFAAPFVQAQSGKSLEVEVFLLTTDNESGLGASVGKVIFKEIPEGIIINPQLKGLPPGQHGFHIHTNPSLSPMEKEGKKVAGLGAGGHYDSANTGKHLGPYDLDGHLGDLPVLFVDNDGTTPLATLAPRIKSLDEIRNRSLMIHLHGDNYSDTPKSLGGGGARLAGGIIK